MPTPTKGPRLGGSPAHERIILANLASQLFEHGKITTTEAKAKRVRPLAEKLITKAKRGDLHSRRLCAQTITDKGVLHTLFAEIAPQMAGRDGGYTRITKIGNRKGDNAPMALIEIVTESVEESRGARTRTTAPKTARTAAPSAAPAAEATAEPSTDELRAEGELADETAALSEPTQAEADGERPADHMPAHRGEELVEADTDEAGTPRSGGATEVNGVADER